MAPTSQLGPHEAAELFHTLFTHQCEDTCSRCCWHFQIEQKKNIFCCTTFSFSFAALGMRTGPVMLLFLKHFIVFYPQFSADQRVAVNQRPGTKHRPTALRLQSRDKANACSMKIWPRESPNQNLLAE